MPKCSVTDCSNAKYKIHCRDKTFFKFPLKNKQLLQVWLKNIGRRCFKPSRSSVVCSDHFLESSYAVCPFTTIRKLKQGAVPVIFQKTPQPKPVTVFLSTACGSYPQLDNTNRIFPGAVPSNFPNSPAFTSSQPLNSSENPHDKGRIKQPEIIIPGTVNPQEQVRKEECGQISTIQPPNGQLKSQNLNCVPVLFNNTMILLPLNVTQAPAAISGTESQNVAEASITINQESVKSAVEPPPQLVIKEIASSSINSLPSISSSFISLSTSSSSSSHGSAPFPGSSVPFVYPYSTNIAETSIAIKQEPVESAAAPLPRSIFPDVLPFACPNSTNVAERSIVIKQEPTESAAAPPSDCILPSFVHPNSTNVTEKSIAIKQEPTESAAAPPSDCVLPECAHPNSTNVAETPITIKQEPIESVDEPPQMVVKKMHLAEEMASSTSTLSPVISLSFSIPSSTSSLSPSIGSSGIISPSTSRSSPSINPSFSIPSSTSSSSPSITSSFSISSSTSSSSASCSSTLLPQNALPFAYPDSTNANKTPAINIPSKPTQKRIIFIKDAEPDTVGASSGADQAKLRSRTKSSTSSKPRPSAVTSKKSPECASRTSRSDLCWRTLMSMASKRSSDRLPSARTSKKSSGPSTENGKSATGEILHSLLVASESNPLFGSKTAERSGDLFDAFADFVADKLRRMDLDDCAHALKAIVDIVSEPDDEVQEDNEV